MNLLLLLHLSYFGIAEFAALDIAGLENDGLEIGGLIPAAPAAAVPQPRCCEVCLLEPIEGFLRLVLCGHARFVKIVRVVYGVADMGGC